MAWLALLAGAILLAACSADRPELVQPAVEGGSTTSSTTPLPDRADCSTATGPGPVTVVLVADTVPCLVVAAHQPLELVNQGAEPIEVGLGPVPMTIAPAGSQVTEPAGTILSPGPNRVEGTTTTVAVVWLADPAEDTLGGAAIGLSSIGDIELGSEPPAVAAATNGVAVAVGGSACYVTSLDGDPYSPLFTFRDDRLVVVQVFTPGLVTLSGVGLGATSAEILAAYGDRIEARPDPAGDPARQLLIFVPSDEENQIYRLVFDLTDDRVTTIRFGATEIVADRPGCGA